MNNEEEEEENMAAKFELPSVHPFVIAGEQTNLHQRWTDWIKRFQYYIDATGITNAKRQHALLLHLVGTEVQDIFQTLENTGEDYATAVTKLTEYFEPQKNNAFERHIFRRTEQEEGETISSFYLV